MGRAPPSKAQYPYHLRRAMIANHGMRSQLSLAIASPYLTFVGKVNRHKKYNRAVLYDHIFQRFVLDAGIDLSAYTYVVGSIENSYNILSQFKPAAVYEPVPRGSALLMLRAAYSCVNKSKFVADPLSWMDASTSPGFPYNLVYPTKLQCKSDPRILRFLALCDSTNEYPTPLWSTFVKAEPKKTSKVLELSARNVQAAPFHLQYVGSKLFAQQNEHIYDAGRRGIISSTVGWSKFHRGMEHLYARLTRFGRFSSGADADFTHFDKTMTEEDIAILANWRFSNLVAELQTFENWVMIKTYYAHVLYSHIVMEDGDIWEKMCGNSSGQSNTLPDNSIVNEFRWYYMWCVITPVQYHTLSHFREHIELCVCGDDTIYSISLFGQIIFPLDKILKLSFQMGWNFKISRERYAPIHTLVYCSSRFMWFSGHVVPVPDNPVKLCVSLMCGSKRKPEFIREQLSRALGIRMEIAFLPHIRSLFEQYIAYVFTNYTPTLKRKPPSSMLSYDELLNVNFDFSDLLTLYLDTDEPVGGLIMPFSNDHIVDLA